MIKFSAKMKVLSLEEKSIKKRDGGTFDFTEAKLEQGTKYKTIIMARVYDDAVAKLKVGTVADMDLGITSTEAADGRIFNNFVVTDVIDTEEVKEKPKMVPFEGDELPF